MADVYIRQGDYEKAKEILNQALENLGDNEAISEKIDELENGDITDSNNNIRRRNSYAEDGSLEWYHDLFYDIDGRQTKVVGYTADGIETGEVELIYNEKGELVRLNGCIMKMGI